MAVIPISNLTGLPVVTPEDLKNNDPARLNRIFRLLATQLHAVQTGIPSSTTVTNITQNLSGGGSAASSGSGGSGAVVVTIQGTHLERLSTYLPADEPAGTYYYETDRQVTYLNYITPSTVQVWQWVSGTMMADLASRPADLTQYDAGFLFYATDKELMYQWSGSAWAQFITIEPVLQDTYANWTSANYPPATYSPATLFIVEDRGWIYSVQVVSTVNTWVLVAGIYGAATASKPTTGFNGGALGTNDAGMLFIDTTLGVIERWSGAAWLIVSSPGALTTNHIFIGNGSNVPVDAPMTGDATIALSGGNAVLTFDTVNGSPGTFGDGSHVAAVTVNGKGLSTAVTSTAITGSPGDFAAVGNIKASTAGKGLQVKAGTNARVGTGTLVGGTLAVANTSVTANTLVFLTDQGGGVLANIGSLYAVTTPSTGFTVTSSNPLDTSNFAYLLVESL